MQRVGAKLKLNDKLRAVLGVEVRQNPDLAADLTLLVGVDAAVIVDVGANLGQSAELFVSLFPKATVYAAEPYLPSYQAIMDKRLPRVEARLTAIGSVEGIGELNINAGSATNSLLRPNTDGRSFFPKQTSPISTVRVPITRLDTFIAAEVLTRVDLLKIDVQGSEMDVLRGADQTLAMTRAILIECNFVSTYVGSSVYGEVDSALRKAGFEFYNFYGLTQDVRSKRYVFGDALYCNFAASCR
jgi:FkbM family methyltransferase